MAVAYRPAVAGHRERVLAWGDEKVGKSQACIDVVEALTDCHHYVIESDFNPAWNLLLDGSAAERVTREQVWPDEWAPYTKLVRAWSKEAGPNDWLYVDSMTPSWPAVRQWYTETVMGKTTSELLMAHAKAVRQGKKKGGNPLEGDTDWGAINAVYNELYMAIARFPGHVMLTSQWKKLGDRDSADEVKEYSGAARGHKPDGQKDLGRWPATSLILTRKGHVHQVSTHGDRTRNGDREKLDKASWEHDETGGFFKVYFRGVAGWKMVKV